MTILTEKDLAKKLGVSYWTVRSWRLQLGLPHFRTAGRIFYRWESVMRWMDSREKENDIEGPSNSDVFSIAQ